MIHSFKGNPFQLAFNLGSLRFKALETSVTDEPGTWIGTGEFERNWIWRQKWFPRSLHNTIDCIPFTSLSKIKESTTAYMNYVILIGNDSEKWITENKSKHQNLGSRHPFKKKMVYEFIIPIFSKHMSQLHAKLIKWKYMLLLHKN